MSLKRLWHVSVFFVWHSWKLFGMLWHQVFSPLEAHDLEHKKTEGRKGPSNSVQFSCKPLLFLVLFKLNQGNVLHCCMRSPFWAVSILSYFVKTLCAFCGSFQLNRSLNRWTWWLLMAELGRHWLGVLGANKKLVSDGFGLFLPTLVWIKVINQPEAYQLESRIPFYDTEPVKDKNMIKHISYMHSLRDFDPLLLSQEIRGLRCKLLCHPLAPEPCTAYGVEDGVGCFFTVWLSIPGIFQLISQKIVLDFAPGDWSTHSVQTRGRQQAMPCFLSLLNPFCCTSFDKDLEQGYSFSLCFAELLASFGSCLWLLSGQGQVGACQQPAPQTLRR